MKLVIYDYGTPREVELRQHNAAVLEVSLPDGRTVQLTFDTKGTVRLRGWGNVPILVGNGNELGLHTHLAYEEPTCDKHGNPLPKNAP
jgi:hypothetical protein